jgi:hypothetical protein
MLAVASESLETVSLLFDCLSVVVQVPSKLLFNTVQYVQWSHQQKRNMNLNLAVHPPSVKNPLNKQEKNNVNLLSAKQI